MNSLFQGVMKSGKSTAMGRFARAHQDQNLFWVKDRTHEWGPDSFFWGERPEKLWVVSKPPAELPESGFLVFRGVEGLQVARWCAQFGGVYLDDEADVVCGDGPWRDNPLRAIIHRGRHLEVEEGPYKGSVVEAHALLAGRRMANFPTDVSNLVEQAFIFQSRGDATLKRLVQDGFIAEDETDDIQELEPHHFKHWPSGEWLKTEGVLK